MTKGAVARNKNLKQEGETLQTLYFRPREKQVNVIN